MHMSSIRSMFFWFFFPLMPSRRWILLRLTPKEIELTFVVIPNKPCLLSVSFFPRPQLPQSQPQPVRIIPSQSTQPTSLPKPLPSIQHAARPPLPTHFPHATSLPTCPGRGKMSKFLSPDEMTSRDYYFDSYAHFGIHEVHHMIHPSKIPFFFFLFLFPLALLPCLLKADLIIWM